MTIEFDYPLNEEINRNVSAALAEDVGAGDLTASLVPGERRVRATVISREAGVLCGTAWFDECVARLDPSARVRWQVVRDRSGAVVAVARRAAHRETLLRPSRRAAAPAAAPATARTRAPG